ncbi:MAG: hypothetical protein KDK99_12890, partial [Verrucomicrobiales bacterium]|nr:hypothetical protein [Verrucomicrobiales bacterium]
MPPHKFTYDLPSNEEPSVLREDGIEYGFIGRLQGLIGDQAVPVQCIEDDAGNGYVWHTTGSGKTLTSF